MKADLGTKVRALFSRMRMEGYRMADLVDLVVEERVLLRLDRMGNMLQTADCQLCNSRK